MNTTDIQRYLDNTKREKRIANLQDRMAQELRRLSDELRLVSKALADISVRVGEIRGTETLLDALETTFYDDGASLHELIGDHDDISVPHRLWDIAWDMDE